MITGKTWKLEGGRTCRVLSDSGTVVAHCGPRAGGPITVAECMDNAALVAKAPELLSAALGLLAQIRMIREDHSAQYRALDEIVRSIPG